jgi:DNA-binding response OmpR family regulator
LASALVVNDFPSYRSWLSDLLERDGLSTVQCRRSSRDIRDCVLKNSPNLIVVDEGQKHRLDWNLLTLLRDDPATKALPVLVISVDKDDLDSQPQRLRDLHVALVPRPFTPDELLRYVRVALQDSPASTD